jgi:hypothetical protein
VGVFESTFTTGAAPDIERPRVASTSPFTGASGVATNAVLEVAVDEPVDPVTLDASSLALRNNATGQAVPGTRSLDASGRILRILPDGPLAAGASHTLSANSGLTDLAGNVLIGVSTSFTTGTASDLTPPEVTGVNPAQGDVAVPTNALVTIQLSEPIAALSLTGALVSVTNAGGPFEAQIATADGGRRLVLLPLELLSPGVLHTLTVSGLEDLAGNIIAGTVTASFTTGPGADLTRPSVESSSPAANATGVSRDTIVTLTFDEPLNPLSISAQAVQIQGVTSTVELDATRRVITVTPQAPLAASTQYTVTADVEDTGGNPDTFGSIRFTTGP